MFIISQRMGLRNSECAGFLSGSQTEKLLQDTRVGTNSWETERGPVPVSCPRPRASEEVLGLLEYFRSVSNVLWSGAL